MVRGEAASGALSICKHGLLHIRYFENGPLEPRYAPNGSYHFPWQFLTFSSVAEKSGHYRKVISAVGTQFSGRYQCKEEAVVDRFKQEPMYELPTGRKEKSLFSKEVSPLLLLKKWKNFILCFFSILYRKKCLLHKRKVKTHGLTSLKNWDFSKGFVSPWIW